MVVKYIGISYNKSGLVCKYRYRIESEKLRSCTLTNNKCTHKNHNKCKIYIKMENDEI